MNEIYTSFKSNYSNYLFFIKDIDRIDIVNELFSNGLFKNCMMFIDEFPIKDNKIIFEKLEIVAAVALIKANSLIGAYLKF